ncbi:MAG: 16S rRNA (uracil(1498)-N(3))-methyltransferase [Candidatus Omnitrophica bacterium]|nr:16S rRNA (uracil(1498)-N(3))-methyltransferase [Candidatus Omnitrophota bacterium]
MNLILLEKADFPQEPGEAVISGRRAKHVREVLKPALGDVLRVGVVNGKLGQAQVISAASDTVRLRVCLDRQPPPKLPLTLILALPRPIVFKRILATITTMGVGRLIVLDTNRVEKSFWKSPALSPDKIQEQLVLGLEQAGDTILPVVEMERNFARFVSQRVSLMADNSLLLVAHPGGDRRSPSSQNRNITLVIGPEGGFIPLEIQQFLEKGFVTISCSPRVLRVETAVTAFIAKLFY